MTFFRSAALMAVLVLSAMAVPARADEPRQGYGPWERTKKHYYHRDYAFQATPDSDVEVHRVIWYPSQPGYYYYWNPKTKVFWGRACVVSAWTCKPLYQFLKPEDRKGDVKDIPEKAFGPVTAPPKLSQVTGLEKAPASSDQRLELPADGPPEPFTRGPA